MATINPYLSFNGSCEEAFNFYKSVFGGEFGYVGRYTEMPAEYGIADTDKNKIMHISLPISKETSLMGADATGAFGSGSDAGSFSVSINTDSDEEATKLFNGLSAGGTITMPLEKTFWGSLFGMFTDKYGVKWMVSHDQAPA